MASTATVRAVREYASRVEPLYAARQNAAPLAERLLRLRAPITGNSLELPLQCTEGPNNICIVIKHLLTINEFLKQDGVKGELIEDAPGKLLVRTNYGFWKPLDGDGGDEYEHAAILLHCLVSRHRCIESVQFGLALSHRRDFELLFCDALTCAASVTCLRLNKFEMNAEATAAALDAICRLLACQLRDLDLDIIEMSGISCASLDAWAEALAATTSLKRLKITDVQVSVQETGRGKSADFVGTTLRTLANSSSISILVVDGSFAAHRHGASFKRMLLNPAGPFELTVSSHNREYRHKANLVFEALVTSTSVKKLTVDGFVLGTGDAKAISNLLACNATIEDISCETSRWNLRAHWEDEEERHRWHTQHLVKGLKETKSLRRLAIRYDFFSFEIRAVLTAARDCASLTELHLDYVASEEVQRFHDALVTTDAGRKVTVGCWGAADQAMTSLAISTCRELLSSRQKLHFGRGSGLFSLPPPLFDLCRALVNCTTDHLTSLEVSDVSHCAEQPVAEALSACLPLMHSLRNLALKFRAPSFAASVIISGIIQCACIEVLTIQEFSLDQEALNLLCEWLRDSRKTHSLNLSLPEESRKRALETLALVLQSSYSLTSIALEDFYTHKDLQEPVHEMVRRNYGLLRSAVGFVFGAESKRAATAFELVSSHPQLLEDVQRIGSLSQPEAGRKITDAEQRLRRNFWRLTVICKEEVVCNVPDGGGDIENEGSTQLNELGPYLLEHISSFLKISDVLDDEDEQPAKLLNEGISDVLDDEDEQPPKLLKEGVDPHSSQDEENQMGDFSAPVVPKRRRKN